ncbi:B3/B4 domain-containing protein [Roseibium sp. Sym1]|uniref:B3/B4 domain-containing protein n=1 Tax=Roseibium sp. Sym1 TaxID=3016006 RepID=UPI0022B432EA|nr:phenylalanine--tRNA ligase beta subunit-related protein [Roseibium sp. Sym1]
MAVFNYADSLAADFPHLCVSVVRIEGITGDARVDAVVERNLEYARRALETAGNESRLVPVSAWRSAYSATGTNPTKYRMAAESILRRLRTRNDFPCLHPLINLCNSLSARFAIPIAALDADRISGNLTVRKAAGGEPYHGFDGSVTGMPEGEVTFLDGAGVAHARRWSHRQSGLSAVSGETGTAVIFAEALHEDAKTDLGRLEGLLLEDLAAVWPDAVMSHALLHGPALRSGFEIGSARAAVTGPAGDRLSVG